MQGTFEEAYSLECASFVFIVDQVYRGVELPLTGNSYDLYLTWFDLVRICLGYSPLKAYIGMERSYRMPYTKRIVCLANSIKNGRYCVAGKEIKEEGFGAWVRPVSDAVDGALTSAQTRCQDGNLPSLLDVITIQLSRRDPQNFQTENHLIFEQQMWIREAPIRKTELPLLLDRPRTLWVNGSSSTFGLNDEIRLYDLAEVKTSLLLIKPSEISFKIAQEYQGQRKIRAIFEYRSVEYGLVVTDPIVRAAYIDQTMGTYSIAADTIHLCISLAQYHGGNAYKLVAGVVNFISN